ncbi:MAG TPA: hypothetical protein VFT70_11345 [Nocardioides sp.]|nr:hypothetical protein [Nocardioides sp.]
MRERRLRPLALLVTVAGVVVTLVALTQLTWVHLDDARTSGGHGDFVIVFDDPPGRHTTVVWVLFVLGAVAALAAGWTSTLWSLLLRCAAPLLAGGLAVVMAWQVYVYDVVTPVPGWTVDVELAPGFWWTLLGLALMALGSAFGATRARAG